MFFNKYEIDAIFTLHILCFIDQSARVMSFLNMHGATTSHLGVHSKTFYKTNETTYHFFFFSTD